MTGERVVVVGNGVSGFACAARLADAGVPVTMIGPGLPHDRPPLSKRALASGAVPWLADAAALAARRVDHLDGRVETINLKRRRLGVATAGAGDVEVAVDGPLVWATGLAPMPLEVPGGERAVSIATAAGMLAASAQLAEAGRSVVVIGAGLIGCEAAATLARRHRVWLLERGGRPVERLGPVVAGAVERALAAAGVTVLTGCRVGSVGTAAVETETHGSIAADVVIAAAGVDAALPLALAPAGSRSLEVDGRLRVAGADGVWACGDLAAFEHPRHGRMVVPHWDNARASGVHAADSIAGGTAEYRRDPYWFSDVGGLRLQQLGVAATACEWSGDDQLRVGLDGAGRPVCALLLNAPARLAEARRRVAAPVRRLPNNQPRRSDGRHPVDRR